jgi:putative ATPase
MARDELFPDPAAPEPGNSAGSNAQRHQPLAARLRPRDLTEFVGQTHLLGSGRLLRRAIDADRIQSLIFYGPPGTGKTSLAQIIARQTRSRFERLSGVESNVADMRRVLAAAANRLENTGQPTILFIDEIHRFNKAQQDVLLPDVESGVIRLIGATTHNPFFFVNSPLVSRSQIFELRPLSEEELSLVLHRALADSERGLGGMRIRADEPALRHLAKLSDGDARKALNAVEIAALTTPPDPTGTIHIDLAAAEQSIQKKAVVYDDEDEHYDTISAFIKSMRGSDPDATLYWLAKMFHAGEDPRFIARRIVIHAAEDVGRSLSAGPRRGSLWRRRLCTSPPPRRATAPSGRSTPRSKISRRAAPCRCRSICATPVTKGPNDSGTVRVTNTPTIIRSISWRRTTWARTGATMSRPSRDSKGGSGSAWRNGAPGLRRPGSTGETGELRSGRDESAPSRLQAGPGGEGASLPRSGSRDCALRRVVI